MSFFVPTYPPHNKRITTPDYPYAMTYLMHTILHWYVLSYLFIILPHSHT